MTDTTNSSPSPIQAALTHSLNQAVQRFNLPERPSAIKAAMAALLQAQLGACRCLTKTPEPQYHATDCPYRIYAEAFAGLGVLALEITSAGRCTNANRECCAYWQVGSQLPAVADPAPAVARQLEAPPACSYPRCTTTAAGCTGACRHGAQPPANRHWGSIVQDLAAMLQLPTAPGTDYLIDGERIKPHVQNVRDAANGLRNDWLAASASAASARAGWERECADSDALLALLGMDAGLCRTDAGSLNLARIKELLAARSN